MNLPLQTYINAHKDTTLFKHADHLIFNEPSAPADASGIG